MFSAEVGTPALPYCKMKKADYYKYCMLIHKLSPMYIINPNCFSFYLPLADGRRKASPAIICIIQQVDYFLLVNEMGGSCWALLLWVLNKMKSISLFSFLPHLHLTLALPYVESFTGYLTIKWKSRYGTGRYPSTQFFYRMVFPFVERGPAVSLDSSST